MKLGFARRFILALSGVVDDVVGSPQELGDSFMEEVGVAVGHIEFDRDGATDLHPYFRCILLFLY